MKDLLGEEIKESVQLFKQPDKTNRQDSNAAINVKPIVDTKQVTDAPSIVRPYTIVRESKYSVWILHD